MHLPLLVRPNSIVPMSDNEAQPEWRLKDPLTLNLFEIANGADLSLRMAATGGDGVMRVAIRRAGSKFSIEQDGKAKNVRVLFRSHRAAGAISNGKLAREVAEGLLVDWLDPAKPLTVTVSD